MWIEKKDNPSISANEGYSCPSAGGDDSDSALNSQQEDLDYYSNQKQKCAEQFIYWDKE